jgi:hypothetical protein
MSKILLAEGLITPTDRLVIELVESIETALVILLRWPAAIADPLGSPRGRERDHDHLCGRCRSAFRSDQANSGRRIREDLSAHHHPGPEPSHCPKICWPATQCVLSPPPDGSSHRTTMAHRLRVSNQWRSGGLLPVGPIR